MGAGRNADLGFATLTGMQERTLVVDSLSKTYAMTGWRLLYLGQS